MPNIHEIIRDHVSLSISCVDRLYVNGYVPKQLLRKDPTVTNSRRRDS